MIKKIILINVKVKAGFTLIELLVVIAIIGVLATIVLVSLNSARDKANNVAIQAALKQVKSIAELIYSESGTAYAYYTATNMLCDANNAVSTLANDAGDNNYVAQLTRIESDIFAKNGGTNPVCVTRTDKYCVYAILKSGGYFCTDYNGVSKVTTTNPNTTCTGASDLLVACP